MKHENKQKKNLHECLDDSRFILSQRASRLTLLTVRKAAASAGVLPCWRPSVLSACARQHNEPTQVIKGKCIDDWTLYVSKDKRGKKKNRSNPTCESRSGSSARSFFLFLKPEIRGKNAPSCQDLKLRDNRL